MAGQDDSADKSQEPTQRKLDEARKKGEIPRSPDLLTACAYLGLLLGAAALGPDALMRFAEALMPLIEQPDRLDALFFDGGAAAPAGGLVISVVSPLLPLLAVPAGCVLLALFAVRGVLFTPSKLTPKVSRISPIQTAKQKFGPSGLFEFAKSFVKLLVYSVILGLFLQHELGLIAGSVRGTAAEVTALMLQLMLQFLMIAVIVAAVIGAIDVAWQHADHRRRNRMSMKEVRDEFKEAEGDPFFKQKRRSRAQELALQHMMAEVPRADVVIVNPTHYAVALRWDRAPGAAPVCVAKGVDESALRIRAVAQEAGVPIHSDPPTARALHATVELGDQIAPEHYRAVAAAIRFAEDMRRRARQRGWG